MALMIEPEIDLGDCQTAKETDYFSPINTIRSAGRKGVFVGLSIAVVVICIILTKSNNQPILPSQLHSKFPPEIIFTESDDLPISMELYLHWSIGPARSCSRSKYPRCVWPAPPAPEYGNGYLLVHCIGGLYQHRSAIADAVLVARIMNATLVLPELDVNSSWNDDGGFEGIYDVENFIDSLWSDVRIVRRIPETQKIKAYQLQPPRDAPVSWYTTVALEKIREHGAIYLTPFSHSLVGEIDNPEYQRLRCRVIYGALSFKQHILELCTSAFRKLRRQGPFIVIDLHVGMEKQDIAECLTLKKYPNGSFTEKKDLRAKGNCPLTPEEVGLILRAMGFDSSTRIYLTAGEAFGGERFMKPFRTMFPRLENHSTVDAQGVPGPAIDYLISLNAGILLPFMPIYDGPSEFANTLLGHRIYRSLTTVRPNRKELARILNVREKGQTAGFQQAIWRMMLDATSNEPHSRLPHESFYANPWPECFCQKSPLNPADKCLFRQRIFSSHSKLLYMVD